MSGRYRTRSLRQLWHSPAGLMAVSIAMLPALPTMAQPPAFTPEAPASPRESAAIDLTGSWVSIVNEDWRWRMRTPPKGDYESVLTLNPQGRAVADAWDPSEDGSCKAYGAPGLMRMPTRLRISWESDDVLKLETDAGEQTRLFRFASAGMPEAASGARSLQGDSVARWNRTLTPPGPLGFAPPPGTVPPTAGGSLEVTTANLSPGWLRRNGVPYSERTVLTEYFDRFEAPNGDEWLIVTAIVSDPVYHSGRFITSSHFKREADDSAWDPVPCRVD